MKINKKGFSIIYVFYITILVSLLGLTVLSKQLYFEKNLEYTQIQNLLFKNISKNFDISIQNHNINPNEAKAKINGIIIKNNGWRNIFWNNTKINNFISGSTNSGSLLKLGDIDNGVLFFEINGAFSGKIIEFDRNVFNNQNKLKKVDELNFFSNFPINGYLQNDLSFSGSIGNPKIFNFSLKDYAIFLSYSGTLDNISYTLKVFNQFGSGVYINPIKDDTEIIEYLGNNILLKNGQYFYKIYKLNNY